jgi:hypothetical protein
MVEPRVGRVRRGFFRASIVVLALTQASPGPAAAQVMANTSVATAAGAVIAQRAAAEPAAKTAAPGELPPASDIERQGYGCLVGGGTAAVLSAVGGATETVMVVAGGMLRPTNSIVLWTALAGTVIAAACAAGALATPSVLRLWDYYHGGLRPAAK